MRHQIPLQSAYAVATGDEPKYTNYTGHYKGVLDYQWFSADRISCVGTEPTLPKETLERHGEALPNVQFPSDHVCLCSDFIIHEGAVPGHLQQRVGQAGQQGGAGAGGALGGGGDHVLGGNLQ
jgi:mRNA deadenylase 3'-5' endonuclease subunit Ccr4